MSLPALKTSACIALCIAVASCATSKPQPYVPLSEAKARLPQSSAECLAQNLKAGDPFPASAIPEAALKSQQSGWVAMTYDVVAGRAQNIVVVESRPSGVYDAAALSHAAKYIDPKGSTVRGCVMTIEVKF
jgi:outer membrane biosynthesis protein TonB